METQRYDVLILGGGQAARRAAEGARQADAAISIALVGEEPHLPYERPPLSKQALADPDAGGRGDAYGPGWYADRRIETRLATRVTAIRPDSRTVETDSGETIGWGRLIIATGSRPRRIDFGVNPERLHILRTLDDARRLSPRLAPGRRIAIVGAGFIGLEVAAAARAKGTEVDVFEAAPHAMARVLPAFLTAPIEARHRAEGVGLVFGGAAEPELLQRYDEVVVGIGVLPNVELAEACGISCADGILVDEFGRTNLPEVFAAGEVVRAPGTGGRGAIRRESWQMAETQAYCVGLTAGGTLTAYREIPWFWSDQYDLNIQVLGDLTGEPEWVVRGVPSSDTFTAFAVVDGEVRGVFALNSGRDIAGARRLMSRGIRPSPQELADPSVGWNKLLASPGLVQAT
ncbi:NAD(P)/FAD-dependent oxidoreductase [Halodurantibacterium flavum]|uniref:NAD(P)/FAD-dependent oxidoreductase n=1 Tax=Halodurantibacterium flavum TaxID=1382802 RepID=A0ABW4S2N5_9RHOB